MTEHNPLRDMLSNVMSGDLKAAGESFSMAMDTKVGEALDAEKVAIASSLYAEGKKHHVAEDDHEDEETEGEEAEGDKKKKKSEEDEEDDAEESEE